MSAPRRQPTTRLAPWLIAAILLAAIAVAAQAPGKGARKPATHTVVVDGSRFEPSALTVTAGDTVVWVNRDLIPHTATSASGGFDSRQIDSGGSWKLVTGKKGTFPYVCTFHPTMKAELRVR